MAVAKRVVEQAIGEKLDGSPLDDPDAGKNPHAVALGRMGGMKGGKALTEGSTSRSLQEGGKFKLTHYRPGVSGQHSSSYPIYNVASGARGILPPRVVLYPRRSQPNRPRRGRF